MEPVQGFQYNLCYNTENRKNKISQNIINQEELEKHF